MLENVFDCTQKCQDNCYSDEGRWNMVSLRFYASLLRTLHENGNEVLAQVDDRRLTVEAAANLLDLTRRQVFRLLKRYRADGAASIRHKSCGKTPNNLYEDFSSSKDLLCQLGVCSRIAPLLASSQIGSLRSK